MPVINEVELIIQSVIENLDSAGLPEGDSEKNTSDAKGILSIFDDESVLNYSEKGEGGETFTEIRISSDSVTVKRSGSVESEFYFKEGEEHHSVYSVPPYKFDATIRTRRIRKEINALGGSLDLIYNMRIGGADKSARMRIWIKTASRQG